HQPELGEVVDQLVREAAVAVELGCDRLDAAARELPDGRADELLLLVQVEVHGRAMLSDPRSSRPAPTVARLGPCGKVSTCGRWRCSRRGTARPTSPEARCLR